MPRLTSANMDEIQPPLRHPHRKLARVDLAFGAPQGVNGAGSQPLRGGRLLLSPGETRVTIVLGVIDEDKYLRINARTC